LEHLGRRRARGARRRSFTRRDGFVLGRNHEGTNDASCAGGAPSCEVA
jgi:hypothetical protein